MIINMAAADRLQRQRCKVCWNADGFNFNVPNDIWNKVIPKYLRNKVVCLRCFDDFATIIEFDYSEYITSIYFAGDKATFKFNKENF